MAGMTNDERNGLQQEMLELFKADIEQSANPGRSALLLSILLGFSDGDVVKLSDDGEVERKTSDDEIKSRCERAKELKIHEQKSLKEIIRTRLLTPIHRN